MVMECIAKSLMRYMVCVAHCSDCAVSDLQNALYINY